MSQTYRVTFIEHRRHIVKLLANSPDDALQLLNQSQLITGNVEYSEFIGLDPEHVEEVECSTCVQRKIGGTQ